MTVKVKNKSIKKNDNNSAQVAAILNRMQHYADFAGVVVDHVNVMGILGDTPLNVLAVSGDVVEGRILLCGGADPDIQGELGCTPLHNAIGQGHVEFVRLLLEHGAATDVPDEDGQTAVDWAKKSSNKRIRKMFKCL